MTLTNLLLLLCCSLSTVSLYHVFSFLLTFSSAFLSHDLHFCANISTKTNKHLLSYSTTSLNPILSFLPLSPLSLASSYSSLIRQFHQPATRYTLLDPAHTPPPPPWWWQLATHRVGVIQIPPITGVGVGVGVLLVSLLHKFHTKQGNPSHNTPASTTISQALPSPSVLISEAAIKILLLLPPPTHPGGLMELWGRQRGLSPVMNKWVMATSRPVGTEECNMENAPIIQKFWIQDSFPKVFLEKRNQNGEIYLTMLKTFYWKMLYKALKKRLLGVS